MKSILTLLAALLCVSSLSSCASDPASRQRALALGTLGLDAAVARGIVKPGDALLIKDFGTVLLTPAPQPVSPVEQPNNPTFVPAPAPRSGDAKQVVPDVLGKVTPGKARLIAQPPALWCRIGIDRKIRIA